MRACESLSVSEGWAIGRRMIKTVLEEGEQDHQIGSPWSFYNSMNILVHLRSLGFTGRELRGQERVENKKTYSGLTIRQEKPNRIKAE